MNVALYLVQIDLLIEGSAIDFSKCSMLVVEVSYK
jgi:hypothetical protein